jgi:hypothetical protein
MRSEDEMEWYDYSVAEINEALILFISTFR